jgi:Kef-type K+ transport system membrane component KefB/mannitol/fructose-specific phosphotransferase system IIA component (Ntr-type)
MSTNQTLIMLVALALLLTVARALGELCRRFGQPAVLGEILAGILLGPSVFGHLAPNISTTIFPQSGPNAIAIAALSNLAMVLFLLVAGMEVELSLMRKQGNRAIISSATGKFTAFSLAFVVAWLFPSYIDAPRQISPIAFAMFFATALSVCALPVIAKTLMDLSLYRSDFGMTVIAAAILSDLVSWLLFALTLGMLGHATSHSMPAWTVCVLTLAYCVAMLTAGRWLVQRAVPWIQAHTSWPGGILGFSVSFALLNAALTEWIGIHAVFGAFIAGLTIGDSPHLRQHTRSILNDFVSFIFAPLFFAGIGLRVNFATDFDLSVTAIIIVVAIVGMVPGSALGARWAGMSRHESLALGFALNSRGAMEIIIGLLGLEYGLITKPTFVALVIVALLTAMMSGPMIQHFLDSRRRKRFHELLTAKAYLGELDAHGRLGAIERLAQAASATTNLDWRVIARAVWAREEVLPTGLGHGVAVPHARIAGIKIPFVAVGLSKQGIDFDAFDGEPAHLIILLITSDDDTQTQLELLADIGRCFADPDNVRRAVKAANYTQFREVMNTQLG